MPCRFQIFSQSDYLIQIVDINSHSDWKTLQIQISWLLQKPTDLDLHCLQRQGISGLSRTRVNLNNYLMKYDSQHISHEMWCMKCDVFRVCLMKYDTTASPHETWYYQNMVTYEMWQNQYSSAVFEMRFSIQVYDISVRFELCCLHICGDFTPTWWKSCCSSLAEAPGSQSTLQVPICFMGWNGLKNCPVTVDLTLILLNKLRCHTFFKFSANQITYSRLLI